MWAEIGEHKIWKTITVKLLGITIDNKFDEYLSNICIKANRKLTVFTSVKKIS